MKHLTDDLGEVTSSCSHHLPNFDLNILISGKAKGEENGLLIATWALNPCIEIP